MLAIIYICTAKILIMIKPLTKLNLAILGLFAFLQSFSQTSGTLTFSFTPVAKSPCYSGSRNVLAVWIEDNTGAFVKTNLRYCCNGSTRDHLPTWSVNAGGTAANCSGANTTGATTGATLTSFSNKSFTWNGTDKNGAAVADGVYKVMIQETWNHGSTGTATSTYTFTKGPAADHQTPTANSTFSGIKLDWVPNSTGISSSSTLEGVSIYPNPNSTGIFHVDFESASKVQVVNMLGETILSEKIQQGSQTATVDLSTFDNGSYFIFVSEGERSSIQRVILNK